LADNSDALAQEKDAMGQAESTLDTGVKFIVTLDRLPANPNIRPRTSDLVDLEGWLWNFKSMIMEVRQIIWERGLHSSVSQYYPKPVSAVRVEIIPYGKDRMPNQDFVKGVIAWMEKAAYDNTSSWSKNGPKMASTIVGVNISVTGTEAQKRAYGDAAIEILTATSSVVFFGVYGIEVNVHNYKTVTYTFQHVYPVDLDAE
jgi:hypothetical protein